MLGETETTGMLVRLGVSGRPAVIVGGGEDASAVAETLLLHGAVVTVIACAASVPLHALAASERIGLVSRDYVRGDLAGAFLAVCFEPGETASAVAAEANAERCLVSIPGRPDLSTIIMAS